MEETGEVQNRTVIVSVVLEKYPKDAPTVGELWFAAKIFVRVKNYPPDKSMPKMFFFSFPFSKIYRAHASSTCSRVSTQP